MPELQFLKINSLPIIIKVSKIEVTNSVYDESGCVSKSTLRELAISTYFKIINYCID